MEVGFTVVVGSAEGRLEDGLRVGQREGSALVVMEGRMVGDMVGGKVGTALIGLREGSLVVGVLDGVLVGVRVGDMVVLVEGYEVTGREDGDGVGMAVESNFVDGMMVGLGEFGTEGWIEAALLGESVGAAVATNRFASDN